VGERPELVDRIVALRAAKPFAPAGWIGQDFAGSGYRYTASLPDLDLPVLVLQGTDDRVVNPAVADVLEARWPHAKVVRLDGLGHLPHWEDPERIASLLTAWAVSGEVAS
jgi:pimeloyl-ACP methyl ester carboxylesterase